MWRTPWLNPRYNSPVSRERCQAIALLCGSAAVLLHRRGSLDGAVLLVLLAVCLLVGSRYAESRELSAREWAVVVGGSAAIGLLLPTGLSSAATVTLVITALLTVGCVTVAVSRPRRALPALLIAAGLLAVTCGVVVVTGHPVDVYAAVSGGASDVAHGVNPYLRPDVTYAPQSSPTRLDALPDHFPYGPLPAVLGVPGWLVGDVRWSVAACCAGFVILATMLARRAEKSTVHGRAVAALCLSLPIFGPMILNSWVDAEMVVALALWLWMRPHHPRWSVLALAAALCVKPTVLVLLVPLAVWSRATRRQLLAAALLAALVCLPFVFGVGLRAFWEDLVGLQLSLATRVDALTVNAALWWHGLPFLPSVVGLGLTVVVAGELVRRPPRDLNDALSAGAAITMASLVLAKFAYFNYYFPALAMLVIALAVGRRPVDEGEPPRFVLSAPL